MSQDPNVVESAKTAMHYIIERDRLVETLARVKAELEAACASFPAGKRPNPHLETALGIASAEHARATQLESRRRESQRERRSAEINALANRDPSDN